MRKKRTTPKKRRDYKYTKIIHQQKAFEDLKSEVDRLQEYAKSQDDLVIKLLAELVVMKHNKARDLLPPRMKGSAQ